MQQTHSANVKRRGIIGMHEQQRVTRVPIIARWLTKMERYFRLMKYLTSVSIDVIINRIKNAVQAWLDKVFQDVQLGQCNP